MPSTRRRPLVPVQPAEASPLGRAPSAAALEPRAHPEAVVRDRHHQAGSSLIVRAAPKLAMALGYDVELGLEEFGADPAAPLDRAP